MTFLKEHRDRIELDTVVQLLNNYAKKDQRYEDPRPFLIILLSQYLKPIVNGEDPRPYNVAI